MTSRHDDFGSILDDDRDRITLLDRALEDATPQQKARVRGVLRRLDIDDDHEFYIIVTAIGYLIVLVQDAPESWRQLFDEFEAELDEWSEQNLRTLAAINQQSELTERMSKGFRSLAASTNSLSSETKASQSRLQRLSDSLERSTQRLDKTESHSRELANYSRGLTEKFSHTDSRIKRLENLVIWISGCSLALLFTLFVGGVLAYRHVAHQNRIISWMMVGNSRRSEWMLDKANRAECVQGIKPPSDPQCQQFQE